jgi:cytochrome c oxidase subunit II
MRILFSLWKGVLSIFLLFFAPSILAENESLPLTFNMTPGVTPISRDIFYLHMTIFTVVFVTGVGVFGVLIYSLIKYRKSQGHKPADFHGSILVEIIWTVIPFLILVVIGVPATLVLMRMTDEAKADVNIKVIGYQWKWRYEYLDEGINYFSNLATPSEQIQGKAPKGRWYLLEVDKPLVIPIHKKIRFLVTSNDVIHSWWVPAFGIKRDAIPGFIHESWARVERPGIYRGQCAELCGINHGFMPIVVEAKTDEDYKKWVTEQTQAELKAATQPAKPMTAQELMALGKTTYDSICAACHKPDGSGTPPAFPALRGSAIATGPISAHIHIVLDGKSGTAMQAFKSQLSVQQLAAVITYERNSWGNNDQQKYGKNAGGIVQPVEIQKVLKP